jgi:hypothetical protein
MSEFLKQFGKDGIYHKIVKLKNPSASEEEISIGLDTNDPNVARAAASHPNATKEHLDKAINYSSSQWSWGVRARAASHPNATKEHLDQAIKDSHFKVREAAASHPNATKEHLDRAVGDNKYGGELVRRAAAGNPNATKEHLDKALNDMDDRVVNAAKQNLESRK